MLYSAFTRRLLLATAMLVAMLALMTSSIAAQALSSTPSGALDFALGDDSAFVSGSVSYSIDPTATVPFSIAWDTAGVGDISVVQAQITFDATLLELDTAVVTGNWSGDFDYSLTVDEDTTGWLLMEFTGGSMSPPTGATDLAELTFEALCQEELTVNPLELVENSAIGFVIAGGNKYYPPAGNWADGAVIVRDYYAEVLLPEVSFTGEVGTEQWVDITASCNFSTYIAYLYILYDGDKLDIKETQLNNDFFQTQYGSIISDGVLRLILIKYSNPQGPGAPEMDNDTIVSLKFELECDIANDTAALSFLVDSCVWVPAYGIQCQPLQDYGADFTDVGYIAAVDSAGFSGYFDADPVGMYDFSGTEVDLIVQTYNTFVTGILDSTANPITFNINFDGNYSYESDDGDLTFDHVEQNDSLVSLRQAWTGFAEGWSDAVVPTDRHTVTVEWEPGGFTPIWTNRFAPPPEFIHSFAQAYGPTTLPDMLGCFEATEANGMLELGDIEPLEVRIDQVVSPIVMANNNCPTQVIRTRANFDLDSLSVTIHVRAICDIEGTSLRSGVVVNQIDDSTIQLYTDGSFATITDTNLVDIAQIEYSCASGCGTMCNTGVHFEDGHAFGTASDSEFVQLTPGAVILNSYVTCIQDEELQRDIRDALEDDESIAERVPENYELHQNYPNPFNPITAISFDLPHGGEWSLKVYNIAGQVIDEFSGSSAAGTVSVDWDASRHASGVYLYRLETADFAATKKMLLIK